MNVRLNKEQKIRVLNSDDLFKVLQQILLRENKIRRNQEHFWVIGLDSNNKILFIELVALGSDNRVNTKPPIIFRIAVHKLCYRIILSHNHPSGTLSPSKADINFTDRILKSGQIIDIEIYDHMIVSEEGYYSFKKEGTLKIIQNSGMYEIMNTDKASMIKLKVEVEKERIERDKAKKIAKKMKDKGVDEKTIKSYTGLYLDEIRKL